MEILIITVVLVLILLGAVFGHRQEKMRRERLAAVARQLGWSFDPEKDRGLRREFPQFKPFDAGDQSRYGHNVMRGEWPAEPPVGGSARLECVAGDYHYVVNGSQDSSDTTYRFSFLLAKLPVPATHDLRVRPENLGDRVQAAMGFDDIDFESAEFSKRYHVSGRDKRFVYDVIHPRMIEFLLESNAGAFEVDGGWLCVLGARRRWKPEEFRERIAWAADFISHWPRHLRGSLGSTDNTGGHG